MKKLFSLLLVFVLVASILTGCGKSKSKETAKGTTEEITEAPTEPASRVPLIPIKDLEGIQFGMIESEVEEAVEKNGDFSKEGTTLYYNYGDYTGDVSFEYENAFLKKIEIEYTIGGEDLNDDLFEHYSKLYKVEKNREEYTALGYKYLASGFSTDKFIIIMTYDKDNGKVSVSYELI